MLLNFFLAKLNPAALSPAPRPLLRRKYLKTEKKKKTAVSSYNTRSRPRCPTGKRFPCGCFDGLRFPSCCSNFPHLSRNADRAGIQMALPHHSTSEDYQRRCRKAKFIGSKNGSNHNVESCAERERNGKR